jgi:hypothetical protein
MEKYCSQRFFFFYQLNCAWGRLLEKSYPGEVVPRRSRTQEKSCPKNWVRFLLEKSYPGTISSGEIVPINIRVRVLLENLYPSNVGYEISWWKTLSSSVIKYWVRLLLRKELCHFKVIKLWVRVLLWKIFDIFSHKILGTSSPG